MSLTLMVENLVVVGLAWLMAILYGSPLPLVLLLSLVVVLGSRE